MAQNRDGLPEDPRARVENTPDPAATRLLPSNVELLVDSVVRCQRRSTVCQAVPGKDGAGDGISIASRDTHGDGESK